MRVEILGEKIQVPGSYQEMNYGQLEALVKITNNDFIDVLAIFLGEFAYQITTESAGEMLENMQYLTKKPAAPEKIGIDGKEYKCKVDLKASPYGSRLLYENTLNKYTRKEIDFETFCRLGVATYMQPVVDGNFSEKRINEIKDKITDYPVNVVMCNDFFLTNFLILRRQRRII